MLAPVAAMGQKAVTDSIMCGELSEIVVEANNQVAEPDKTIYIPGRRQREAASDGVTLLGLMNIPQLSVNRLSGEVKTAANQPVDIFINYHRASREELSGLKPADVKRVEYLQYPTDPRFLRAQFAVNIITRKIDYGGYTKLSAKERFMVNSGNASVYSKFNFKVMEYDAMLNGDFDRNARRGTNSRDLFRFEPEPVERIAERAGGSFSEHDIFAGLGVTWNRSERLNMRNVLTYNCEYTPRNSSYGFVAMPQLGLSEEYAELSDTRNQAATLSSSIYADLGGGFKLNNSLFAEYDSNRSRSEYTSGSTAIENGAVEHSFFLKDNFQFNKAVTRNIGAFANLIFGGGRTDIKYSGSSSARNKFTPLFGGASLGVTMSAGKLSGSADGGFAMESSTINGKTVNDAYPFTHIDLQFAPNQKNTLGLWFQYAAMSADAAMKNPNEVRANELLYIAGNPDLKCAKHISVSLNYTFLPGNRWQMSAYASMFRIMDRQVPVYRPDGPGGLMLKKYYNDGDYNHGQLGARMAAKFFGGSLAVAVSPKLLMYDVTGANAVSHYPLCADVSVDYYFKSFALNAVWYSPMSYVDGETCYRRDMPGSYALSAVWASHGWNVELAVVNIFRKSWQLSDDRLQTRWFDSRVTGLGADYHARVSLSVVYTFSYGRKVSSAEELRNNGGGSSSILR